MRQEFLIMAVLVAAAPALADDRPLVRPSRDVAVEYHFNGAADPGNAVTMRFAAKISRVRIDGSMGRDYGILDTDAGRMIVVKTEQQGYMERPADPGMLEMFQPTHSTFRKTGTDTVAGVACTTYDATINDRTGQVCLTSDGVLLRARSDDADRHRQLEAVKVTYAVQPASLFETPAGFRNLGDTGRRPLSGFGPPQGQAPKGAYMGTETGR